MAALNTTTPHMLGRAEHSNRLLTLTDVGQYRAIITFSCSLHHSFHPLCLCSPYNCSVSGLVMQMIDWTVTTDAYLYTVFTKLSVFFARCCTNPSCDGVGSLCKTLRTHNVIMCLFGLNSIVYSTDISCLCTALLLLYCTLFIF